MPTVDVQLINNMRLAVAATRKTDSGAFNSGT
jgi:hypothetical protein